MLTASVVMCAYNEGKNIEKALAACVTQATNHFNFKEVVVVSSGSTDDTDQKVRSFAEEHHRIPVRLIVQPTRQGKAAAINAALSVVASDIVILCGADLVPAPGSFDALSLPFQERSVGMTGARIIPGTPDQGFWPRLGHMLWRMHHFVAMQHPKLGELVAFRAGVVAAIDRSTAVDEAYLEATFSRLGFVMRYVPEAIVYNATPLTLRDWNKQRRRIYAGHLQLRRQTGYVVASDRPRALIKAIWRELTSNPLSMILLPIGMSLAAYNFVMAAIDVKVRKKSFAVWEMVDSTKGNVGITVSDDSVGLIDSGRRSTP